MQFLEYEKNNNRFIRAVQHDAALAFLHPALISHRTLLLVPQDVCLEGRKLDLSFAQHHIIVTEHPAAQSPLHFVTLSGMRGTFMCNLPKSSDLPSTTTSTRKRDSLCILTTPSSASAPSTANNIFDPTSLFAHESFTEESARDVNRRIVILREGTMELQGGSIPMILISDTIDSSIISVTEHDGNVDEDDNGTTADVLVSLGTENFVMIHPRPRDSDSSLSASLSSMRDSSASATAAAAAVFSSSGEGGSPMLSDLDSSLSGSNSTLKLLSGLLDTVSSSTSTLASTSASTSASASATLPENDNGEPHGSSSISTTGNSNATTADVTNDASQLNKRPRNRSLHRRSKSTSDGSPLSPSREAASGAAGAGTSLDDHATASSSSSSSSLDLRQQDDSSNKQGAGARSISSSNLPRARSSLFVQIVNQPSAAEIVKSLKKFIASFLAKPPPVHLQSEQVRTFIASTERAIEQNPAGRNLSDKELEEFSEGLEKFVMSKIYSKVTDPQDLIKDEFTADRIRRLQFLTYDHLDINPLHRVDSNCARACAELLKINQYKVPRDKLVCILNCCKLLYTSLQQGGSPAGADDFLPLLIYTVIKASPPHLHSNIQYIRRFRNPSQMIAEHGYYCTQLESAVHFIDTLDASQLTIDPDEFTRLFEAGARSVPPGLRRAASLAIMPTGSISSSSSPPPSSGGAGSPTHTTAFTMPFGSTGDAGVPQYQFVNRTVESLTIGEIGLLLAEYKHLVAENQALQLRARRKSGSAGTSGAHFTAAPIPIPKAASESVVANAANNSPSSSSLLVVPSSSNNTSSTSEEEPKHE